MTETAALPLSGKSFALAGPSQRPDPAMTPVRGDLAHVALAGRVFVPHYAVPMPHRALKAVPVMASVAADANPVGALSKGGTFAVLDMAGQHAWGMIAGDAEDEFGPVGYVPLDALEAVQ